MIQGAEAILIVAALIFFAAHVLMTWCRNVDYEREIDRLRYELKKERSRGDASDGKNHR